MKWSDSPYLLTMGTQNGGWVRYQLFPASMHGHRVNLVNNFIDVNDNEPALEIESEDFYCIHCKLMGTETTMQEYTCDSQGKA
jgi:hypothetical protein